MPTSTTAPDSPPPPSARIPGDANPLGESAIANVSLTITAAITSYQVTAPIDGKWSLANIPDGTWTEPAPPAGRRFHRIVQRFSP